MTRSQNRNKKRGRKRPDIEVVCSRRQEDKKPQSIAAVFKGEEIQEIAGILGIAEPDDSQTLLGAVVLNKFDVVKKLLKDGFSIDSCKEDGVTPLMWAVRLKHWEMTELLIKRGANLNLEDKEGNTALMTAGYTKSWTQDLFIDLWNLIKDSGVNINHINKTGNTMLHLAVKRNWEVVVDLILIDGANPNLATNKGVTAIMLACSRHQVNIIETLLAHSADLSLEDQKGCTACCYAIAYMIQKRIVALEFATEEMVSYMRSDNNKISIKSYLKRRLELLQNPPEENFSKTIFSVIVHIITFFLRFVLEGISTLLQLNVFRSIRNAIEKHIEDNEYVSGLLKILTELVRYCECCTPHIPWDSVVLAFNKAGIPCLCLRLQKRFGNSPLLHATFLPLFLTCKHAMTKLWLQKNFKCLSQYYRQYIQIQSVQSEYNFYPNEAHSQMVRKLSLQFKQLIGQLQRGNVIQQEQRLHKKRKEKSFDKKKTIQHNLNFFKKNGNEPDKLSSVKIEDNKKQSNKEENIIVAVISNKKKEEMPISVVEEKPELPIETYWSLDKINEVDSKVKEIEAEIDEELDDETIYSRWKEEFKEGCQLFGIPVEGKTQKWDQEICSSNTLLQENASCNEMETKISELEGLFGNVLNMYEETWQQDFAQGYENVNNGIKDYLKLMYTLPNMEMYHWAQVTEKWKELCVTLRQKCRESGDKIPYLKTYLDSCAEGLKQIQYSKIQNEESSITKNKETDEQNSNSIISIEQFIQENQEEIHSKIKKEYNSTKKDEDNNNENSSYCETSNSNKDAEVMITQDNVENNETPIENQTEKYDSMEEKPLQSVKEVECQCQEKIENIDSKENDLENSEDLLHETESMKIDNNNVKCRGIDNTITGIEEKITQTHEENFEDFKPNISICSKLVNDQLSVKYINVEDSIKIWMGTEITAVPLKVRAPPPGFGQIYEVSKLKEIYKENWRQTDFVINRYKKYITTLSCMRSLLLKDIIMPPPHIQMDFLIGHGGSFGSVTLALDLNSGKPIVVKKLAKHESIALQIRAWKIHSLMRRLIYVYSEFLVPYSHCVNVDRFILLATPLCQKNIKEHMAHLKSAGFFTRERAISLVRQTMGGLHYLHSQDPPIMHGNLKPTNLLIDAVGNLRLSDFGIYEIICQKVCTSTKADLWWSRETYFHYQIDWTVMVTCLSDVQVLGMLSHYILTGGLHPFGRTPAEIATAVIHGTPILRLDSHEALDIISWMLSTIPEKRPPTAEIIKHVFNWNEEKRWRFLLVCAGIPTTQKFSLGLVLDNFHNFIDKYAIEQKINTKWAKIASKKLNPTISTAGYSETLTGLLNLLRDQLPSSACWFLSVFPSLPLILCRLLEDSPWFSHPDLAQFRTL